MTVESERKKKDKNKPEMLPIAVCRLKNDYEKISLNPEEGQY